MRNDAKIMSQPAEGSETLRVLCLEDSPDDADLVGESLSSAGMLIDMKVAPDRLAFADLLTDGPYALILADFALHGFDARGALELASTTCPTTPLICERLLALAEFTQPKGGINKHGQACSGARPSAVRPHLIVGGRHLK